MEKYKRQFFLNEKLSKQQVDALLKDIKEIIIKFAEGNVEYSNRVKGKKFKTMKKMVGKCIKRLCEINGWEFKYDDFKFTGI